MGNKYFYLFHYIVVVIISFAICALPYQRINLTKGRIANPNIRSFLSSYFKVRRSLLLSAPLSCPVCPDHYLL